MEKNVINDVADSLLGLGTVEADINAAATKMGINPSQETIRVARSVAASRVKKAVNNTLLSRNQAIFATKAGELPAQSVRNLQNGTSQIIDGERYIAVLAVGATGTQELLRNAPNAAIGVSNLDEGKMPSNANMLLSALKVEIANSAASANVDAVEYTNQFDAAGLASSFQNGEIEIQADGRVVVPSTPMSKFFSVGGAAMSSDGGARVVKLSAPKMLPAGAKIEVIWRKPANGTLPANNNFIKVTLIGPETATR